MDLFWLVRDICCGLAKEKFDIYIVCKDWKDKDWLKCFQLGFHSVLVFVCDIQQQRKDIRCRMG
jgi:hypothetical protein